MIRFAPIAIIVAVCFSVPGFAQDGLYDAPPPADAAFVRLISGTPGPARLPLGGVDVQVPEEGVASPYYIVSQGQLSLPPVGFEEAVAAQKYYSIAIQGSSALLIDDTIEANLTKATIVVYNLTDLPDLDLTTADGATSVFSDVAINGSQSIEVNPISIGFALTSDGSSAAASETVKLERGQVYSIVATGSEPYKLTITQNSIAPAQ